ncbi:pyridoxal phosphate-dependent aminotransferase [Nitrospirillum iridis]|uniref:histidinol-phosphate transaminase n=1 Tax=Nitrospirillum iridis TaxID=765888 RepID=A0A7X0B4Y6_9PROT|nr:histidinol-phosphate transaminase [Nitrospirillum iridis]MBB6254526.1 histidinol-phosphate aminotransferase [Nitrospirillum iridis]
MSQARLFDMGDSNLLRLQLSESHWGPSPSVRAALDRERERLHLYPDPSAHILRQSISAFHGVAAEQVLIGNGSDEVLLLLALAYLAKRRIVAVTPGFPGYAISSRLAGAQVEIVQQTELGVGLDDIMTRPRADAAFICHPNNPTGGIVSKSALAAFVAQMDRDRTLAIVDEAYAEFAGADFASAIPFVREGSEIAVLRTFSKAYGLAALRVGYIIAPRAVIAAMEQVRASLPFSVNHLAQVAAHAALSDQAHLGHVQSLTAQSREEFCARLAAMNVPFLRSDTNFVAVGPLPDAGRLTVELERRHGILVRHLKSFGLPNFIRISMPMPDALPRVVNAISLCLAASLNREAV